MKERSLDELLDRRDPGMSLVKEWISRARNPVEELPADPDRGRSCLLALQVTSRSPLGGIALETGGLLIDGGWLRVLGSGHARLPRALDTWNGLAGDALRLPQAMVVGDDAIGGFYALDGGALGNATGRVFYFAPDRLEWEEVAAGYSDWLVGALSGDLEEFYRGLRWSDWRADLATCPPDRAFHVYPPLWAKGPPIELRSRRPVPVEELWGLHVVEQWRKPGGEG